MPGIVRGREKINVMRRVKAEDKNEIISGLNYTGHSTSMYHNQYFNLVYALQLIVYCVTLVVNTRVLFF
jgi:hypothetical protein